MKKTKTETLKEMKNSPRQCYVIPSLDDFDIAKYRKSLKMTQAKFAEAHDINLGTLKKWERHSSEPIGEGFKRVLNAWLKKESVVDN